ncbi:MAG: flagellar hook-associated protein FlgK [Methylococcaceae bacterium]|nr:MAG: flagellar hook-associated protein FlgK [Methylococcaceae bacterium]
MSGGILDIVTSGVQTFQRSLQTISHNVTNVNTEGYSRQRTELVQRLPNFTGAGYMGNGVESVTIRRSYDEFLAKQIRTDVSSQGQLEVFNRLAKQVDNFTADSATSLNSTMQRFFDSIHEVADNPTSIAARQVMLGNTSDFVDRLKTIDGRLSDLRNEVNTSIKSAIDEVNGMASSIARLNDQIVQAFTLGQPPNDLLDQRDNLVESISKKVGVSIIPEKDGAIDVVIGNGQPLVLGSLATTLQASSGGLYKDPFNVEISIVNGSGRGTIVTNGITGGELGGLLNVRSQILDPAQNALGAMAVGVIGDMNVAHQQGYDLNGNKGQPLFSPENVAFDAYPLTGVTNRLSITLGDPPPAAATIPTANGLTGSDYLLTYNGANYTITRLSDNTRVYNDAELPTSQIDGMTFAVPNGALSAGDNFLIQPARHVIPAITLNAAVMADPKLVAASSSDVAVGDNKNALAMAALPQGKYLGNSSSTYQEAYNALVGTVATRTHTSEINLETQTKLLDQAKEARSGVSGVNLDEEAANIIQYQQSYQAAAQMVSVVNQMFESLMGAVRG